MNTEIEGNMEGERERCGFKKKLMIQVKQL